MNGLDQFLQDYGLLAIFALMLVKAIGVPIPIPADVIMLAAATAAATGRLSTVASIGSIFVAMVVGGVVQYLLVRRVGRAALYRIGRFVGLTPARLDTAADKVRRGGPLGIGVAVLTPGMRAAAVASCGLADVPLRTFVPGLALGSGAFLALHFALGLGGASILSVAGQALPVLVVLLVVGFGVWWLIRRRQRPRAPASEIMLEAFEAWHEATCPVCLALGAVKSLSGVPHEHDHPAATAGGSYAG